MTDEIEPAETSRIETTRREFKHGKLIHQQTTVVIVHEPTEDELPTGMYL